MFFEKGLAQWSVAKVTLLDYHLKVFLYSFLLTPLL